MTPSSIVGRRKESEALAERLLAARAGRGGVHAVVGEAGIGKSRLATETARRAAAEGYTVAWGRCAEAGGAPAYGPWIHILRSLRRALARARDARAEVAATILPRLLGEGDSAAVDPAQARLALFETLADFVLGLATPAAPIALVFEDLHAADPSSLALLRFLAREHAHPRSSRASRSGSRRRRRAFSRTPRRAPSSRTSFSRSSLPAQHGLGITRAREPPSRACRQTRPSIASS